MAFVNSKIKILTPDGFRNINSLNEGDRVIGSDLKSVPIKKLLSRAMPEDERSVKVRELYST